MFSIFQNRSVPFKSVDKVEKPQITFEEYIAKARSMLDSIALDVEIADLLRLKGDVDSINESRAVFDRAVMSYKAYEKKYAFFPASFLEQLSELSVLNQIYTLHKHAESIQQDIEEVNKNIHFIVRVNSSP